MNQQNGLACAGDLVLELATIYSHALKWPVGLSRRTHGKSHRNGKHSRQQDDPFRRRTAPHLFQ
jgi:hypothetical protein